MYLTALVLRYGLKPKHHTIAAPLAFLLIALALILNLCPSTAHAQGLDRWLGPSSWWDWSDYRFIVKYRFMYPTLNSGTLTRGGLEHDLLSSDSGFTNNMETDRSGYAFQRSPNYFSEGWFQLQVDRLGLRLVVEEDRIFRGILGRINPQNTATGDNFRVSELDLSCTRLGLDLDVIRYPQFRFGFNFDYHLNGIQFNDAKFVTYDGNRIIFTNYGDLSSSEPMTIGLQALAIPGRVKEVPIILTARARVAIPFQKQIFQIQYPANLTDWEITAGLRPSVWDTSAYKFATFALAVELGFRSTYIDAELTNQASTSNNASNVKAKFSGPFVQFSLYY